MTNRTTLAAMAILAGAWATAGCQSDKKDMSQTGPNATPDYAATHYNPAVNDTGSRTSSEDPAIDPRGTAETNTPMNTNIPTGGGNTGLQGRNVGGGTSDQNSGSASPTGQTGNPGGR